MKLEEVLPYVPFVGTPFAVRAELQKQENHTAIEAMGAGAAIGVTSFTGFVVADMMLGDRIFTPTQVKVMQQVWTKGPVLAAATAVVGAVTGASAIYEKKVSAPIRQGRAGV
ncbi:MAG: hypothetical protein ACO3NJ_09095, partial [Candidatus Poseidoniaceae archaeon]